MTVAFAPPPSYTPTTPVLVAPQASDNLSTDKVDSNIMHRLDGMTWAHADKPKDATVWTEGPQSKNLSFERPGGSPFLDGEKKLKSVFVPPETTQRGQTRVDRVLRAHFGKNILSEMARLTQQAGTLNSASFVDTILRSIRLFRDRSPFEPFVEILMALHDAMAFENRWIEYSASQYEVAAKILAAYVNQELDNSKVENAIQKLTRAGFDTLPFGVDSFTDDLDPSSQ